MNNKNINHNRKLNFELVPDGCWKLNLRNIVSKKAWDFLRKEAIFKSDNKCYLCGVNSKRLEAHEVWDYDTEKCEVKLVDIIAVCPLCHKTIHFNRTSLCGDVEKAEKHYMQVNNVSYVQMREDLGKANDINAQRNKVSDWQLNLSWLKKYINSNK